MPKIETVCLTGYYGYNNFGDDLFVSVAKRIIEKNNYRVVVCTAANKSKIIRYFKKIICYLRSDIICYSGGSIFSKIKIERKWICILLSILGKKLVASGVSIGPFNNQKDECQTLLHLKKFDLITVRDSASSFILTKNGIKHTLSTDIVFMAKANDFNIKDNRLNPPKESNPSQKFILLIPAILSSKAENVKQINFFKNYIDNLSAGTIVKIVGIQKGEVFTNWFSSSTVLIEYLESYDGNISRIASLINEARFILTTRLHGAIASIILNKKFHLYQYHPKCTNLLHDLKWPYMNLESNGKKVAMEIDSIDNFSAYDYSSLKLKANLNFSYLSNYNS